VTTVTFIPSPHTAVPIEPVSLYAEGIVVPPNGATNVGIDQRGGIARVRVTNVEFNYHATITTSDEAKPGRCDVLVEVAWNGSYDA
jgi:hypothetical protein